MSDQERTVRGHRVANLRERRDAKAEREAERAAHLQQALIALATEYGARERELLTRHMNGEDVHDLPLAKALGTPVAHVDSFNEGLDELVRRIDLAVPHLGPGAALDITVNLALRVSIKMDDWVEAHELREAMLRRKLREAAATHVGLVMPERRKR